MYSMVHVPFPQQQLLMVQDFIDLNLAFALATVKVVVLDHEHQSRDSRLAFRSEHEHVHQS